jgi:hypothetical protein
VTTFKILKKNFSRESKKSTKKNGCFGKNKKLAEKKNWPKKNLAEKNLTKKKIWPKKNLAKKIVWP